MINPSQFLFFPHGGNLVPDLTKLNKYLLTLQASWMCYRASFPIALTMMFYWQTAAGNTLFCGIKTLRFVILHILFV